MVATQIADCNEDGILTRALYAIPQRQIACIALASMLFGSSAGANPPLTDSADGMTCHYYAVGFRLPWEKKGGDWLDAVGDIHGDVPFGSERIPTASGRQEFRIDVTSLAREWSGGAEPAGGLLLRMVPGEKSGIVDFTSKEASDSTFAPALIINWSDGSTSNVSPLADTYLSCTTVKSLGDRPYFQVGDGMSAIIVFPIEPRPGAMVRTASLILTSEKQYGGGTSTIGIYRPYPPSVRPTERVSGLAEHFMLDRGIGEHPAVIFSETFESPQWQNAWSDFDPSGHALPVETNALQKFERLDGKSLQVTIKEGSTQGLNMHYRFARTGEAEPEEIYFRYYLRFGESWDPAKEGGKLPGLAGTYGQAGWGGRKADGRNGWSARGSFFKISDQTSPASHLRGIGNYIYHADTPERYGEISGWGLGPTGALEKNRWYAVEQHVRLNRPGEHDGILRAWVDGQLAFERTSIRFRDIRKLRIESLWMNVYHGGTRPAHQDLTLFIDNVVLAREYIGPAGTEN